MKSKLLVSALTLATGCLLGAIPAEATTIQIGLAQAPGIGPITTEATGTGVTGASWFGSYDNYLFNVILAIDPAPISLVSGTLDVTLPAVLGGPSGPVYVYVTETGLTSPQSSLDFLSQLSIDSLPAGWAETESTYLDGANTPYGTATLLASSSAVGTQSIPKAGVAVTPDSPFSVTEVYAIYSNGHAGIDTSTEYVSASVDPAPAPSIGTGIPGALAVGGVLLGMTFLRRSRLSLS
jgi:hypothetical protein